MGFDAHMIEVTTELSAGKEIEAPDGTLGRVADAQIQVSKMELEGWASDQI